MNDSLLTTHGYNIYHVSEWLYITPVGGALCEFMFAPKEWEKAALWLSERTEKPYEDIAEILNRYSMEEL